MKQPHNYEQWGRAATIPGLQMAVDYLQTMLDEIRAELYGTMAEPKRKVPFEPRTKRGRPPKMIEASVVKDPRGNQWAHMTPEERKAEQRRRQQVARRRRAAQQAAAKAIDVTPNPNRVESGGKAWRNLTPEQRSEEMRRRQQVTRDRREQEIKEKMRKRYGGAESENPSFRETQEMHATGSTGDQLLNGR